LPKKTQQIENLLKQEAFSSDDAVAALYDIEEAEKIISKIRKITKKTSVKPLRNAPQVLWRYLRQNAVKRIKRFAKQNQISLFNTNTGDFEIANYRTRLTPDEEMKYIQQTLRKVEKQYSRLQNMLQSSQAKNITRLLANGQRTIFELATSVINEELEKATI